MPLTEFTIKLLLLFLPGVICAYILDAFSQVLSKDRFFFLLRAFVCGFLAYMFYGLILWVLSSAYFFIGHVQLGLAPWESHVTFLDALVNIESEISLLEIVMVCLLAVVQGFLLTAASTHKLLYRFARWTRVARKFGDSDVWSFTFNSPNVEWITFRDLEKDLVYDGWVNAFSEGEDDAELLMRDVSIYRNSTGDRLYQVAGLYICRPRNTVTFEIRSEPVDDLVRWQGAENERPEDTNETGSP